MSTSVDLQDRIDSYIEEVREEIANAKPGAGLLGFGNSPRTSPCHAKFYNDMKDICQEIEDPFPSVQLLLTADKSNSCPDMARWMLTAVQGLSLPLIEKLDGSEKAQLMDWYDDNVPRRVRLPVQKDVYKALKK